MINDSRIRGDQRFSSPHAKSVGLPKCRRKGVQDIRRSFIESCLVARRERLVPWNLYRAASARIIRMPNTPEMSFPSAASKRTVTFCFPSTN